MSGPPNFFVRPLPRPPEKNRFPRSPLVRRQPGSGRGRLPG